MPRLLALLAVLAAASAAPAQFVWNTTTGTWDVPANWVGNAVPPSDPATQLVFNNTGAGYTSTHNIGAGTFQLNRLTVNNTGTGPVVIAGAAAANSLTFAGTAPTLDVQAGTVTITAVLAGSANLIKVGAGTAIQSSNSIGFTGTLTVNEGTFASENLSGTHNFNPTLITVNGGGTYRFGNNGAGNPNLPNATYITVNAGGTVLWQIGEVLGGLNLQGGTVNLQQGDYNTAGSVPQQWTSGTLTGGAFPLVVGANAPVIKTTAGVATVSGGVRFTGAGPINIDAGTLAFANPANVAGTNTVTLGNEEFATSGTLEYQGAAASRGGLINVTGGGGTVGVTAATGELTLTGTVIGTGSLAKTGPGALTFATAPGHTGLTTVAAGTVRVLPGGAAGGFQVNDGAVLAVAAGAGTATFSTPSLALTGAAPVVQFDLNAAGPPTAPLLTASTLTGGGVLRVVNQQPFAVGTYPLVDYAGAPITTGFVLQLPGRTAGSLVYNTADTRLDATVTGTDSIRWGGQVNNVWDTGTAANVGGTFNFRLASNGTDTNFIPTDTVRFDDTGLNPAVSIAGPVAPAAVTVDNGSVQYTFTGPGRITGTARLTKLGTGALVVGTDNDYTGGTDVTGGLLQLGNGGTTGSVTGTVTLAANTTLAFNRSAAAELTTAVAVPTGAVAFDQAGTGDIGLGGVLSGAGTVVKTGPGTLTLLADNSPFVGTVTVNGGTLALDDRGAGGDVDATLITVNSGATFQFGNADQTGNPDLPGGTLVTLNAGGTYVSNINEDFGRLNLQGGAVRQFGTAVSAGNINLTDTANGPNLWTSGTVTDIGGTPTTPSIGGGGSITKTTAGVVTVTGVNLNTTGGATAAVPAVGLAIEDGVIASDAGFGGLGGISFGTAATAGTLRLTSAVTATPTVVARPLTVNAGGGTLDVTTAGKVYAFTGGATGPGTLTKTGPGTLAASGSVAGPLAVTAGTLLPGTSLAARTLTLQSDLTLAAGTAYRVPFFGPGAGTDNGLAAVTGTATIPTGTLLQLDLSALDVVARDAVRANGPQVYTVLTAATVSANFAGIDAAGSNFGLFDSTEFSLLGSPAAGTVQVQFTPVPEPVTVLAVAALGLAAVRRRRGR